MPVKSDFVLRGCIVGDVSCSLVTKCSECKKEKAALIEIDKIWFSSEEQKTAVKREPSATLR